MHWLWLIWLLLRRDLRGLPRRPWFYYQRVGLAMVALLLAGISLIAMADHTQPPGLTLFRFLAVGLVALAFLTGLAIAADLLAEERTGNTLELLFLATCEPVQISLAKVALATVAALAMLVGALPLYAIAVALGGVTWQSTHLVLLVAVGSALLGAATGLWAAAQAGGLRRAAVSGAVGGGTVAVLLPLLGCLVLSWRGVALPDGLIYTSPVFAALAAINGRPPHLIYYHLAGNALLAIAVLALSARHLLGLRQVRGDGAADPARLATRPRLPLVGHAAWAARPALSGNPIAWRDLYLVHGGQASAWSKAALIAVLLLVVIPLLCRAIGLPADEVWEKAWGSLCLGQAVAWCLGTLAATSHAFDREKSSGALDMLLTSDLDNEDLLYGKLGGVLQGYIPYLYALLGALALAFVVYGEVLFQYHLLLVLIELGAVWFACCSAALYLAVRLPASRNATLYFGLYLLAWAIIAITFRQHGEIAHALFALITAIWHLYLGSLCWRLLLRHCREMLLHGGVPPAETPAP